MTDEEIKKDIKNTLNNVKRLKEIPFKTLVEATTGYKVIPIDTTNTKDIELIKELDLAAKKLINACNKTRRFYGNRINDIGSKMEPEIIGEISNQNITVKQLGTKGYPDSEIIQEPDIYSYLEVKISSKKWDGRFRTFYYSNGKKIKRDARHILIGLKVVEEKDKYWRATTYKIIDLSKILVKLKAEYNASNNDVYIVSGGELIVNKNTLMYR